MNINLVLEMAAGGYGARPALVTDAGAVSYHIAGVMGVLTPLYAGRRLAFLPQFEATAWLRRAAEHDVTHAFVVPTMLARIVDALSADPGLRPPSLRHIAYGGGPIHLALVERALALLPDADFVNAYGSTETSSTVALLSPDDHRAAVASDDPAVRPRLGSVGRPVPGIAVRIVDEDGSELPAGEVGAITVAGAQVSGQYRGADAPQGRFATGDLGHLDAEGYLFIGGRSDDVIIRGGENISPGEVEDVLARHPDVRGVGVVGLPRRGMGPAGGGLRGGAVRRARDRRRAPDWARPSLAGFKIPASIAFVDELPRNDMGKVLRRRLRQTSVDGVAEPA